MKRVIQWLFDLWFAFLPIYCIVVYIGGDHDLAIFGVTLAILYHVERKP